MSRKNHGNPDLDLVTNFDDETIIVDLPEEYDEEWEMRPTSEVAHIKPPQILPEYRGLLPLLPAYAAHTSKSEPAGAAKSSKRQHESGQSTYKIPASASQTSRTAMNSAIKESIAVAIIESGKQSLPKAELCQTASLHLYPLSNVAWY